MKHLIQLLIVCCFFGNVTLQAQTSMAITGGDASGAGGSASYTYGQVGYTSIESLSGTVSQGVQHPYEIYVITGLDDERAFKVELSVYPNPSSDHVILRSNPETGNLNMWLYDNNGNLIETKEITEKETIVELENLPSAYYFLRINEGQTEVKTFIIIKY